MNLNNQTKNITKTNKNIFTLMYSSKYSDFYFVNPVNTVGFMGAGLAKEFKKHKPTHFAFYKKICDSNKMVVGKVLVDFQNKIIALPTKKHWRGKSKMIYIREGLKDLHKQLKINKIKKIVIPKIGSGLGGLDFNEQVWPIIKKEFANSDIEKVVISLWNTKK